MRAARPKLVCLAGPTGAGKSALSLFLAEALGGVIVNFDSRQVYADFPIVTAQPSPEEQASQPHRLYGFLPTREKLTAGVFADLAGKTIIEAAEAGLVPILVGGTGLYLRALLQGLAPIPGVPEDIQRRVQETVEREGPEAMHARLARDDPDYAARIHPNDRQRVARALEVLEATGRPLSWWHARPTEAAPYDVFKVFLDLDMESLTPLLDKRVSLMLEAGAMEEIRRAWERCPEREAPGWTGIGCAELLAHLLGETSLDEARELWLRNTRAYAKRQHTWFRKESDLLRLNPRDSDAPGRLLRRVQAFLQTVENGHAPS